jgi:streptogramin lyase
VKEMVRPLAVLLVSTAGLVGCSRDETPRGSKAAESAAVIEDFPIPSHGASPWGITVGRDGAIWFTEARANKIGRVDPKNPDDVQEFPLPAPNSEPRAITTASDGALWFFESTVKKVARMDASSHVVDEFSIPSSFTDVSGLAADRAGGVWFTETGGRRIVRVGARPPHATSELKVTGYPTGIAADPDGDVWFVMQSWSSVGRIRPFSPEELELFALAVPDGSLMKIAATSGADPWFLDVRNHRFGRFGREPPHPVKEFEMPRSQASLVDLVALGGFVWLLSENAVLRFEARPPYELVRIQIPGPRADPRSMVAGPDGNLWFTESATNRIARVVLSRVRRPGALPSTSPELVAGATAEYVPKRPAAPLTTMNLHTDRECVVTIDGVEKGRLRRNDGDVFLVPPGRHVVTAVETETGRSWTRLVDTWVNQGAVTEIVFTGEIEDEARGFEPSDPGIAFATIPPGEFWMGSDQLHLSQAGPRHRVRITRPFEIARSLVTQGQWKRVMNRNPTPWEYEGDDRPVVNVSWDETREFLRRLDATGSYYEHRLPTEAEWEYATRAGNDRAALERDEQVRLGLGIRTNRPKRANAWGLSDLGGTTSEWCQDWYGQDYYRASPQEDPAGPRSGSKKVVKGGDFASDTAGLRPAERASFLPIERSVTVGFRVVRVPR